MTDAGAEWIQLRAKTATDDRLFEQAGEALDTVSAKLWIDDRADLAALLAFAGVHLGQRDLPPADVRRIVGPEIWIGMSTHDRRQFEQASADPDVDLIAVGPVFSTVSKQNPDPVVGLDFVRWAASRTSKPLVAIGGIDQSNAGAVLAAGADSIAVLGAVCVGDTAANVRRLRQVTESCRTEGKRS